MPKVYVLRRLRVMDLTFFWEHDKNIKGRQRAINIDSWIVNAGALPHPPPSNYRTRYRNLDTGKIVEETRPITKPQKNWRLGGTRVRGKSYLSYGEGDIILLQFEDDTITWGVFADRGQEAPVFNFVNDPANVTFQGSAALIKLPAAVRQMEALVSTYDPALFFTTDLEAIEAAPASEAITRRVRRKFTPETYQNLQKAREENGRRGEGFALSWERQRLIDAGYKARARRVRHVSREDPTSPYDILSYEAAKGLTERFIEVKSASRDRMDFEMSDPEWQFAAEKEDQYYIYRVTQVASQPLVAAIYRNPVRMEAEGELKRTPSAYRVRPT